MFRPFLLLLLSLVSLRSVHAQDYTRDNSGPPLVSSAGANAPHAGSAGLRLVFDSRLTVPVDAGIFLTDEPAEDVAATRAFASDSYWKTGAVAGGVLGALAGFGFGYAMDNIINEGEMAVGEAAIGGAVVGAVGGAVLGAGIGSLIRR